MKIVHTKKTCYECLLTKIFGEYEGEVAQRDAPHSRGYT